MTEKTNVEDIIGLVQTDEPTNSVQLKKEAQLNICERKLLDMEEDRDYYKTKSASLEEGYLKLQKENERLRNGIELLQEENDDLNKFFLHNCKTSDYLKWKKRDVE